MRQSIQFSLDQQLLTFLGLITLCCGTVLCIVGCLTASLASAFKMPVASSTLPPPPDPHCDNQKCLNTWPHVPWGSKLPSENHCPRLYVKERNAGHNQACALSLGSLIKFIAKINPSIVIPSEGCYFKKR